jgi:2-polyprenyl-3-methyl-5-hydroxy-6-metoxy-1,4-benzoquinol methylase
MDYDKATAKTLETYENLADLYIARSPTVRSRLVDDLIKATTPGQRVLELGTGGGNNASALEQAGLMVERTDGARAFVDRLQSAGHDARVLSLYADTFGGPYDAVFANAVLLHVPRERLAGVLAVARDATRVGGVLVASFKKGSGEGWSTKKLDAPRFFTYWQEDELSARVRQAGWTPVSVADWTSPAATERWITVIATNNDSTD